MKRLTRKTLNLMRDELGFIELRQSGGTLGVDDYQMALDKAGGNRVIAAMLLGISEGTLRTFICRSPKLSNWLAENYSAPTMVLASEPIDYALVKAELDAGNDSIAMIARKLGHGRSSIKKFFERHSELSEQLAAMNLEI